MAAQHGGRARRSLDRPALAALVLGLVGIGYRLVLVLLDVPGANSDEATFGLAAMHIAAGRSQPVYMYGQHYMGAVESYLAAPLFAAFDPSWVLLRIPILLLYAAFVYLMHRLTRRVYSPWLAVFTVGLLALGSERVIRDQITAVGGRPESKVAVVLLLLIALALGQRRVRRRWLAFGGFGLVAGMTVWDDWLVLPYLVAAVAVLLAGCWRELLGRAGLSVLGGFVVGVLPLILDNVTAPPGNDSLSVFLQLNGGDAGSTSPARQVHGGVLVGVPLASGLCRGMRCAPWQMWWGPLYVLLLLVAAALAVVGLRRPAAAPDARELADAPAPARRIRYVAQLALAAAAGLTVLSYARSPAAVLTPVESARYLTVLQISLPAALWPLWLAAARSWRRAAIGLRLLGVAAAGLLAALTVAMLLATVGQVAQVGPIREEEQRARALAAAVQQAGIRYAYGEYWTCNRLTFNSGERVVCAVLGEDLRPGQNRYRPYALRVNRAARPAFIFATGGVADTAFRDYLRRQHITARVTEASGYRIYQPTVTVRPR